jgi:hypothetical protein
MAQVKWLGEGDDGPDEIQAYGRTIKKGESVEINDERVVRKAASNKSFEVTGGPPDVKPPRRGPDSGVSSAVSGPESRRARQERCLRLRGRSACIVRPRSSRPSASTKSRKSRAICPRSKLRKARTSAVPAAPRARRTIPRESAFRRPEETGRKVKLAV